MKFRLKGASGRVTGKPFDLSDDTLVGSGDAADIRLEGLLERHARFVFEDGTLTLEGAGECWVNGHPANRQPLQSGDEIRLGTYRFVLQAPGLKPQRVLADAGQRRISPWTWVAIVGLALLGIGSALTLVLTRSGI